MILKIALFFVRYEKNTTFAPGKMAEWSIAAVLKTVELRGSGGSNPSLSAQKDAPKERPFCVEREGLKCWATPKEVV